MSREEKRLKSSIVVVKKEQNSEPPDKVQKRKIVNDYEIEEGEIIEYVL